MAQDISLFGSTYQSVPSVSLPKVGGGTATFTDVTGTTAVASDVAPGKTFYLANGQATTGTATVQLVPYAIRPDAELVKTVYWDQMLVADLGIEIPAYSTSAKTLKASAVLDTYAGDKSNYNYWVVLRTLTIPQYSIETKAKGREEYMLTSYVYEMCDLPANSFPAVIDPTKKVTAASSPAPALGVARHIYWSSASALAVNTAVTYGIGVTVAAPTWSGNTLNINSGSITIRGHTTYFVNTFYNALTDARIQVKVDVYRAPKNHLNVDGWGTQQNLNRLIETVNSATMDLL